MNILLVDDDQSFLNAMENLIKDVDINVTIASSGYEAIGIIEARKIKDEPCVDLVVSDYNMKDGDGGSLAAYCNDKGINYCIMTGYGERDIAPYLPKGTRIIDKMGQLTTLLLEEINKAQGKVSIEI